MATSVVEERPIPSRKRFKVSELPLTSAQRSTVDGLLHTIKKKGEYDALRKKVWSQYVDSVCSARLAEYSIGKGSYGSRKAKQHLHLPFMNSPSQRQIAIRRY